jgi:nucleotide-binding universal stress UspA family protein
VLAVPATAAALPTRAVADMEDGAAAGIARRAALAVAIASSDAYGAGTARELLDNAREANADLIVLGSRPPTSFLRRMLGGMSRRVVGSAECSVLLAGEAGDELIHATRHPVRYASRRERPSMEIPR